MKHSYIWAIAAGFGVFILDRVTKYWAAQILSSPMVINNWLSCSYTINRGISFGIADSVNPYVFLGISLIVVVLLVFVGQLALTAYKQHSSIIGHMFVLAGGLSNLLDRIIYHGVIDFIVLSYQTWSWPVFNVADVAINLGILIIVIQSLRS